MRRVYALVLKGEAVLAATFLVAMVALIFTGGVARMMHHPLNWTIDLATCFFAWACFLSADVAWRNDALMSIDIVPSRLPPRLALALGWFNHTLICVFLLYAIVYGVRLSWVSRARSFQGIPSISYSWVTMSIVVGSALLLVTTILRMRRQWLASRGAA